MRVKTLIEIPSARGIIPAGQIIEIPPSVMVKLKGKGKVEPLQGCSHTPKANHTPAEIGKAEAIVTTIWPPEAQALINWFMELEPPAAPFNQEPHIHVIDPAKYFASLKREIESGPSCPRGRNGALLYDLETLRKILH